jgi:signal transduction histidine kinase
VLGIWYWFLVPSGSFQLANPTREVFGMLGFLVFSGFIIALGEANRRSLARSQWAEEQLRISHAELERKVQERTLELNTANENLRELSARLLQMRDEEHRHIARELHDSVGQMLAALSMNLAVVQSQSAKLDPGTARAIADNAGLVDQISREIRTISHLLHPPLLDVAGLASALRWYTDGFSERSRIKVDLEIPDDFPRLSSEMEIAIFRMVQECLTNIHRHAGTDTERIVIRREQTRILIQVRRRQRHACQQTTRAKILRPNRGWLSRNARAAQTAERRLGHSVGRRWNAGDCRAADTPGVRLQQRERKSLLIPSFPLDTTVLRKFLGLRPQSVTIRTPSIR